MEPMMLVPMSKHFEMENELNSWRQVWDNVRIHIPNLRENNKPLAVAAAYELLHLELGDACVRAQNVGLELDKTKHAAGFCEKHQPNGGYRRCLVCGCEELSRALSEIDYLIGEPNDMRVSVYDVCPDPQSVVDRVRAFVDRRSAP